MSRQIGAEYLKDNEVKFSVWAPFKDNVEVVIKDGPSVPLVKDNKGYWEKVIYEIPPGSFYKFRLDGKEEFPDPASLSQPVGVHSWSQVINLNALSWNDNSWKGIPLADMIIYELHIGTFTDEGTFEAVIDKLDHLLELGINTIEILPISQFPGSRNWGYDGVYPYAAQSSYGGPQDLNKMIDACHRKGIAVIIDVVYNHMGPEGNYLAEFGPYFTEKYKTPWGAAINFDDKYSDEVRIFFIQNALMWLRDFHFDGLRLDAIHEIIDRSAKHLLKELSQEIDELQQETGREYIMIAESDLNDTMIIKPYDIGGLGLEAQWVDDFHHSLHTLLTGEKKGYYTDYGTIEQLAKSFKQAFVYDGVYSNFRKRTLGNSPVGLNFSHFVVCIQNHDQTGNRMLGERISKLVSFEGQKLAAGLMLCSPFVPMLFMGEEFSEERPFQYFVSHGDPELVKAVQEGRKREFEYFFSKSGDFPDPQGEETFNASKLNWNFRKDVSKTAIFEFYKKLIELKKDGSFNAFRNNDILFETNEELKTMVAFTEGEENLVAFFNFSDEGQEFNCPSSENAWQLVIASADQKWNGPIDFPSNLNGGEKISLPKKSLLLCKS